MQTSDGVTAPRGCKEIGRLVSAERGKLVAVFLAFSTTGNIVDGFHFPQGNRRVDGAAPCGQSGSFSCWWSDEGGTFFEVGLLSM